MPSTAVDEAFVGAGAEVGLEIWRVEKLKVVKQDKKLNGKFFTGDSYICLLTRKVRDKFEWDIHFWLGTETSQDEAGIAAYKTVELDDSLGGDPVQYREVQNHESKRFLGIFPHGVEYMEGGIDSGFVKVDRDAYTKRLLHVKGTKNIRIEQVALTYESLNHGDVFILDDGKVIYCWNGKDSSKKERIKAAEIARKIRDEERSGKSQIIIIDAGTDSPRRFFAALESEGPIKSAEEGGDDTEFEVQKQRDISLYRVSDASGELKIEQTSVPPLKRNDLDSDDCFILDGGATGVFSWIGKKCTKQEKQAAMNNAMKFIQDKGYPNWTQVVRVVEGGETPVFKQFFSDWKNEDEQRGLGRVDKSNIATYNTEGFDVNNLHGGKSAKKDEKCMFDDGSGTVRVWRINKFKRIDVPPKELGVFYEGDCYLIFYTYQLKAATKYVVYHWHGLKSSTDERGSVAMFAQQLDDQYEGSPVQVRVVQGKEPEHFLRVFQKKMVIMKGGFDSGFSKKRKGEIGSKYDNTRAQPGVQLFQIRGTNELNTRAVEVYARAASLNSNDVFVMKTDKGKTFVWQGEGASEEEKAFADVAAEYVAPDGDLVVVKEHKEPGEFWELIGGREKYASTKGLAADKPAHPVRLFQCSNASGRFWVEEVADFDQDDLNEDDVMLLDTWDELFVWIGQGANFIEKKNALDGALEYIRCDKTGRNEENTNILTVKQGFEPLNFTGYFLAWDSDKWSKGLSYEEMKKQLGEENVEVTSVNEEIKKYSKKYSYREVILKGNFLDGIDTTNKEKHLLDEDFEKYFEMTREAYNKLPKWKKEILKKKLKLF